MDEEVESVGYGGMPNERGVVQLDACIMSGPVHEGTRERRRFIIDGC